MCGNHNNYIEDCLECIKTSHYSERINAYQEIYNNADTFKVGDAIDGDLYGLKTVSVYSRPNGELLRTVKPGSKVGTIYAYVNDKGNIWWQLSDLKSFVKHESGLFDFPKLEKSVAEKKAKVAAEVQAKVDKRLAENTNPLYQAGKTLDNLLPDFDTILWVLGGILVLIVLILIYKITK